MNRTDFFNRIKKLDPYANPPSWAQGCFYVGETQILLNPEYIYDRFYTLAHESFHLLFQKFIYEKNNMNRIVWLDESLAANFDGTTEKLIENGKFLEIILTLKHNQKLPKMNDLEFSKGNIKTENYNGYDLFKVCTSYSLCICSKRMISYSLCILLCVATDVFFSYIFILLSFY